MREKILAVMEKNSRIDIRDLAILLGESEIAVANEIAEMEKEHIICGYHTLINWENTSEEKVIALIEVKASLAKPETLSPLPLCHCRSRASASL